MSSLVVIDKVAVGHICQAFAVAVLTALRGHDFVGDEVGQEGGACCGREAHVGGLHRGRQQSKDFIPGTLRSIVFKIAFHLFKGRLWSSERSACFMPIPRTDLSSMTYSKVLLGFMRIFICHLLEQINLRLRPPDRCSKD